MPDARLATYGTLSPGRANHHLLAGLRGVWEQGTVRGTLVPQGWGAAMGFPGLILHPDGQPVAVDVFSSSELDGHWARLDAFEGDQYRRVETEISLPGGTVRGFIYVVATS